MMNAIWGGMILFSYLFSFFAGTTEAVTGALFSGAENAVMLIISLLGMMCFWTGLLEIATKSGITTLLEKLLSPIMKILFPKLQNKEAKSAITMSIAANFLGLSNAATPLGIAAMQALKKQAILKDTATDEMCMFAVINSAAFTLFPLTLFTLRTKAGSLNPFEVLLPVWICSFVSLCVGVLAAKGLQKRGH